MATSIDAEFTDYARTRASVLIATALRLCSGRRQAAEDLVQETLIRTYLSWTRVKDPQLRDAYSRRIMVRLAQRKAFAEPSDHVHRDGDRPVIDESDRVADRSSLWEFLQVLPARQRAVVVLRFYLDLSEEQTAEALNISVGSVKTHTSRALSRLRGEPLMRTEGAHRGELQ